MIKKKERSENKENNSKAITTLMQKHTSICRSVMSSCITQYGKRSIKDSGSNPAYTIYNISGSRSISKKLQTDYLKAMLTL